ncbi:HEAT repeat domain-containing protein [Cytophagaceae bacterium DM2B3-1]|uniref:HEAT repeat domain-containing protein n=1 Tax=Xanthocytophaga flava TaxID=3048013 RepID=A0ABT7CWS0_9BACT|nr:HEAT repeat domain-containing protein [Xanthocytophaga flavus]MDJ1498214.1 HEAT repeat domain-containing protein [Xanthocytophaga flavus]
MKKYAIPTLFLFLWISISSMATTWEEPWQDQIMREADNFVLGKVLSIDSEKGMTIQIVKNLAGNKLPEQVQITHYYLLRYCSRSAHDDHELDWSKVDSCYFFLKKDEKGNMGISTPTSGYALVKDGYVYATYRHSFIKVPISPDIYEGTTIALFRHAHGLTYDQTYIKNFINESLHLPPVSFEKKDLATASLQHIALECIFHLQLTDYNDQILPFLHNSKNPHNQISAARALTWYHSQPTQEALIEMIANKKNDTFIKVTCIWALAASKPIAYKETLLKLAKKAPEGPMSLGTDLSDPRGCTIIPSVKGALEKVIEQL